jgi:hypothetical protein
MFLDLEMDASKTSDKRLIESGSIDRDHVVSRLQVNDTKAGMNNIDKDKINAIIMKHTKSESHS